MEVIGSGVAWLLEPAHWAGTDGIPQRLWEHLTLSGVAILAAIAVALPVGLWIGHTSRLAVLAVNLANIGRAVPSYALIAIIVPFSLGAFGRPGLSLIPTLAAMTFLAIPPILVNAYAGIRDVDRDLVEAARGMGMRERQVLAGVELPIALPVVVGGIRTAAVQVVATATLGAIFGGGGLGRYLVDGIARREFGRLWAGVILVAALALVVELAIALVQRRLTSAGLRAGRDRAGRRAPAAV